MEFVKGSQPHKEAELRKLLTSFPDRRFILVGDSGELDPEIYGAMAREFGEQVQQILIRKVPGAKNDDARFQAAFEGLDAARWSAVSP